MTVTLRWHYSKSHNFVNKTWRHFYSSLAEYYRQFCYAWINIRKNIAYFPFPIGIIWYKTLHKIIISNDSYFILRSFFGIHLTHETSHDGFFYLPLKYWSVRSRLIDLMAFGLSFKLPTMTDPDMVPSSPF